MKYIDILSKISKNLVFDYGRHKCINIRVSSNRCNQMPPSDRSLLSLSTCDHEIEKKTCSLFIMKYVNVGSVAAQPYLNS